jgi:hypothetical protein
MTHDPAAELQAGHDAAVDALKNPTPELVEAVARKLCDANGCVWDFDPISDARIQWYNDAATALTAAAAHLFAENANECRSCQVRLDN